MFKKSISLCFLLFISLSVFSQSISVSSWNLKNFGKSKSDSTILYIAQQVRHVDVLALQEIVTSPAGAQAVARLVEQLNRMGAKWDYALSDPTKSSPYRSERYAFLWKTSKLKRVGRAWLDENYASTIEREPYFIRLQTKGKVFTLVNFHALPKKMSPETELKLFRNYPAHYPDDNLIFLGDFNLPESHSVFNPLKKLGYQAVLEKQKTTLRQKCINGDCLASEYDNIFYKKDKISPIKSGIIPFYLDFDDMAQARSISDHVPVFSEFRLL